MGLQASSSQIAGPQLHTARLDQLRRIIGLSVVASMHAALKQKLTLVYEVSRKRPPHATVRRFRLCGTLQAGWLSHGALQPRVIFLELVIVACGVLGAALTLYYIPCFHAGTGCQPQMTRLTQWCSDC